MRNIIIYLTLFIVSMPAIANKKECIESNPDEINVKVKLVSIGKRIDFEGKNPGFYFKRHGTMEVTSTCIGCTFPPRLSMIELDAHKSKILISDHPGDFSEYYFRIVEDESSGKALSNMVEVTACGFKTDK